MLILSLFTVNDLNWKICVNMNKFDILCFKTLKSFKVAVTGQKSVLKLAAMFRSAVQRVNGTHLHDTAPR